MTLPASRSLLFSSLLFLFIVLGVLQPALANELDDPGEDGNEDDGHDDEGEVALDHGDIAEEVAAEHEQGDPGDAANDVVGDEPPIGHAADPGHKRREGPNDR